MGEYSDNVKASIANANEVLRILYVIFALLGITAFFMVGCRPR